ncbi:MAG: SpoVG family protein [Lachnospiraceae bacterium]|nr:SpoVG family protein [Lachnospiraceae bacterium]
MKITNVRLKKRENDKKFLAGGSVEFDKEFIVSGIRVMKSEEGHLYVGFPAWKNSDGEYIDVCFPTTKTLREDITIAVLSAYEEL